MATSSVIIDYLGEGLASARPASLTIATTALGLYFATDTGVLSAWDGSGWVSVGGAITATTSVFAVFAPGTMSNGQVLFLTQIVQNCTFPADFAAAVDGAVSVASSLGDATGSTTISVEKCPAASDPTNPVNFTGIGTIVFSASGHTGTLTTTGSSAQAFVVGDWLRLTIATADGTLANFTTTLIANRT